MSMPDRINNIYPIFQKVYPFTFNEGAADGIFIRGFRNGFFIFFGATKYTDGTYDLSIQESSSPTVTGTTVPLSRFYFPRPIGQTQSEDEVLTISGSGGLVNSAGIARLIAIDAFATDAIRVNIEATNITVGAVVMVQIWAYATLSPNNLTNLPVPINVA